MLGTFNQGRTPTVRSFRGWPPQNVETAYFGTATR
jgi:hypothetical protein